MSAPKADVIGLLDRLGAMVPLSSVDGVELSNEIVAARAAMAELIKSHANCIALLEKWAVKIDGEWGNCRELDELERDGELQTEIIEARAIQARIGGAA